MNKEKDLYAKLLYYRPTKIYKTYNAINRSNNISYVLCEKEIRNIAGRFGYHITQKIVSESFVTCTKYVDGQYKVTVRPDNKDNHGESIIITGTRARVVYDHAKKYCK